MELIIKSIESHVKSWMREIIREEFLAMQELLLSQSLPQETPL